MKDWSVFKVIWEFEASGTDTELVFISNFCSLKQIWYIHKALDHLLQMGLNLLLTHEQLEMHGCIINTVAADVLVLRHQATILVDQLQQTT